MQVVSCGVWHDTLSSGTRAGWSSMWIMHYMLVIELPVPASEAFRSREDVAAACLSLEGVRADSRSCRPAALSYGVQTREGLQCSDGFFPDPWADPTSRSTLRFCNLHHRCIRVRIGGSIFWILEARTCFQEWLLRALRDADLARHQAFEVSASKTR